MVPDRRLDRRTFLAGGALSAAALAEADLAHAQPATEVYGAVVENASRTALSVFLPDLGVARTLQLAPGVAAQHGRDGMVTTLEMFRPGEKVVFMPADASLDGDSVSVSELSSLVASARIDVTSDGATVRSSQGSFAKSAHLRSKVPLGRVDATFWVDPSSGERYLCAARRAS